MADGKTDFKEEKYFIYYNNGNFEVSDRMNVTLLHMVDLGVIKIIYSSMDNMAWIPTGDGSSKKVTVPKINNLS